MAPKIWGVDHFASNQDRGYADLDDQCEKNQPTNQLLKIDTRAHNQTVSHIFFGCYLYDRWQSLIGCLTLFDKYTLS